MGPPFKALREDYTGSIAPRYMMCFKKHAKNDPDRGPVRSRLLNTISVNERPAIRLVWRTVDHLRNGCPVLCVARLWPIVPAVLWFPCGRCMPVSGGSRPRAARVRGGSFCGGYGASSRAAASTQTRSCVLLSASRLAIVEGFSA